MTAANPYRRWLEGWYSTPDPWDYSALGSSGRYGAALAALPARTGATLEIGCGEGHFTEMLAPRASRLVGLELVGAAVERARRRLRGERHVRIRKGDALRRLPMRRFDTVVCMGVLNFFPESTAGPVRRRLVRRVAPGGLLLLQHELDEVVRNWDPDAGGAEALHPPFLGLGLEVVSAEVRDSVSGPIETLVLRRAAASRLADARADLADLLSEPWPAPAPGTDLGEATVEIGSPAELAASSTPRRLLLRLDGRPVGLTSAAGQAMGTRDLAATVAARTGRSLAHHLGQGISQTDIAAALLDGQLPRHPLSPEPRPLNPGELQVAVCTNGDRDQVGELLVQIAGSFQSVVVENGMPRPLLAELCRELDIEHHHRAEGGLAAARNLALATSAAPWVLFLDDDCRLGPPGGGELNRRLGGAIDAAAGAGAVTGLVLPATLDHPAQVDFERGPAHSRGFVPVRYHAGSSDDQDWPLRGCDRMGVGACLAVRREAWAAVGGFDERLGPGTPARSADDDAFFRALVEAGWGVFYDPAVSVRHDHRPSPGELRSQLYGYGLGRSAHVLLCALDRRRIDHVRLWGRMLVDEVRKARRQPARLGLAELAGYAWGPAVAIHSALASRGR